MLAQKLHPCGKPSKGVQGGTACRCPMVLIKHGAPTAGWLASGAACSGPVLLMTACS